MGMFDSFIPTDLKCPLCNEGEIKELQTKAFSDPYLRNWHIGDKLEDRDLTIINGSVDCYHWCSTTKKLQHYRAIIEGNIFVGIEEGDVE